MKKRGIFKNDTFIVKNIPCGLENDRQNLVFVKDNKVVVKKMTRNRRKVIGKPGDSLLCRLHSIQLSALVYSFLYESIRKIEETNFEFLIKNRS